MNGKRSPCRGVPRSRFLNNESLVDYDNSLKTCINNKGMSDLRYDFIKTTKEKKPMAGNKN